MLVDVIYPRACYYNRNMDDQDKTALRQQRWFKTHKKTLFIYKDFICSCCRLDTFLLKATNV